MGRRVSAIDRDRRLQRSLWVNIIARDGDEEWSVWNGFVKAPEVQVIVNQAARQVGKGG